LYADETYQAFFAKEDETYQAFFAKEKGEYRDYPRLHYLLYWTLLFLDLSDYLG